MLFFVILFVLYESSTNKIGRVNCKAGIIKERVKKNLFPEFSGKKKNQFRNAVMYAFYICKIDFFLLYRNGPLYRHKILKWKQKSRWFNLILK